MSEFWAGFLLGSCGLFMLSGVVAFMLARMIAIFNPSDEEQMEPRPTSSLNGRIIYERERQ